MLNDDNAVVVGSRAADKQLTVSGLTAIDKMALNYTSLSSVSHYPSVAQRRRRNAPLLYAFDDAVIVVCPVAAASLPSGQLLSLTLQARCLNRVEREWRGSRFTVERSITAHLRCTPNTNPKSRERRRLPVPVCV